LLGSGSQLFSSSQYILRRFPFAEARKTVF